MSDSKRDQMTDSPTGDADAVWLAPTEAGSESDRPDDGRDRLQDEIVSGYPLAREELLTLARHWYRDYLDVGVFTHLTGSYGSSDFRSQNYALKRLDRIVAIVGEA